MALQQVLKPDQKKKVSPLEHTFNVLNIGAKLASMGTDIKNIIPGKKDEK